MFIENKCKFIEKIFQRREKKVIIENANYVHAGNIDETWREVMTLCIEKGWDFTVKAGSYVGQIRKQLPFVTLRLEEPRKRPLAPVLPFPLSPVTSDEKIEKYFLDYLINAEPPGNEEYIYGTWIVPQISGVIEKLNSSLGNTNQACISVGDSNCINMDDPPCLRVIDFKVVHGKLEMSVMFRSWDLYTGLPENLGGLQMLKEYVLAYLDFECQDGSINAFSDGLHIYEQYFSIVDSLNINKISVDPKALKDKKSFYITLE